MSHPDLLGLPVRAFYASDRERTAFEGIAVGLLNEPSYVILTEDGQTRHWAASITEATGAAEVVHGRRADALRYVDVEVPGEYLTDDRDYLTGEVTGYTANPRALPGPAWVEALDKVNADVDSATCAMSKVPVNGEPMCNRGIGWILHETDDGIGSGIRWAWTTLVWVEGKVIAVCEDCAPTNLYGIAATYAKA